MSLQRYGHLLNYESGLLGVSETTSDMRVLLQSRATDSRAEEAVNMFCYQAKKYIGSFTAALGGLKTLIFSGGIGENAPEIRLQICAGLHHFGIEIDKKRNKLNETIVSSKSSKVTVYVIHTNEELMMARLVWQVINTSRKT